MHVEVLDLARMLIFPDKLEKLLENAVKSVLIQSGTIEDGSGKNGSIL